MTGHIRRRGERSWEIKFDLGTDPTTGRRKTRYHSFKGTRREAEAELIRLKAGADRGEYVDPVKMTVSEFLDLWDRDWAAANLTPKSLERYREIINVNIRPELGALKLQRLKPANLAALYGKLAREGRQRKRDTAPGLAPGTIRYVHRVLHRALSHAVLWSLIASNPCASVEPPKPVPSELEILSEDQIRAVLMKLQGRSIHLIAMMGLATGMRRGELLALRWKDIDLQRNAGAILRVEQSLEQTKAGLRFKGPKTRHGRRTISLPPSVASALKAHRLEQHKQRLALGAGRDEPDALVFRTVLGAPIRPNSLTTKWRHLVSQLGLPKVSLHAWRHTHASQLIASGMDVLTISRRLGHGSPSITLNVYGHLFSSTDDRAAAVVEAAFGAAVAAGEGAEGTK